MKRLEAFLAIALLGGLAACQTPTPDPDSTITVAGNYADLAACYAQSRPGAIITNRVARTGFRTVTVSTPSPSQSAAQTLSANADVSLATAYNVDFTEKTGYNTQVSGMSVGPATVPFFWRDVVIRELRDCTGNPTLE